VWKLKVPPPQNLGHNANWHRHRSTSLDIDIDIEIDIAININISHSNNISNNNKQQLQQQQATTTATASNNNMFLPDNLKNQSDAVTEEMERKKAYARIEEWSIDLIPENSRTGVQISVQEVQCGDPECSPIDTAVAILFPRYVFNATSL
jgi:hypothetical protein